MAEANVYGNRVFRIIEDAVNRLESSTLGQSEKVFNRLKVLTNELELAIDDSIKPTTKNLKVIQKIERELSNLLVSAGYTQSVQEFLSSFNEVQSAQDIRTKSLTGKGLSSGQSSFLVDQAKSATVEALTRSGVQSELVRPISQILSNNVGAGGNYSAMLEDLRSFIVRNPDQLGKFESYVSQIATDALNQFSANYTMAISNEVGFQWFFYHGPIKDTTRQFCCDHANKYWHISEVKDMGETPSLWDKKPESKCKGGGMIPGTNSSTIFTYRGGYRCNHHFVPVPEDRVPVKDRRRINLDLL